MANRVLALVKKMFNFALDRDWIDANPAARLKPVSRETPRDRVLSHDEIRVFWCALDAEHLRIATLFRMLLLTAQRSGEVSKCDGRSWSRRCSRVARTAFAWRRRSNRLSGPSREKRLRTVSRTRCR